MANVELSISPDYVADWDIREAVRELYQNALDQQTLEPDNELLFSYDPATLLLCIGNKKSTLDVSTLVMGKTTKHRNKHLIGAFGEGYKLALVVLMRLGKSVTIYNNPEVWTPSIVQSTQFNTPVLNMNIVKYRFKALPEHDLIFKIAGVTPGEYEKLVGSNLHLQADGQTRLESPQGSILLDERHKGHIYVKGLWITTIDKASYGYDFNPEYVDIGRDRNLVNEWEIFYNTGQMWAIQHEHAELIDRMIADKVPDIEKINNYVWKLPKETTHYISSNWYGCHGSTAYPCANQAQADRAHKLYGNAVKTVMVSEQLMAILQQTDRFKSFTAASIVQQKPYDLLKKMLKYRDRFKPSVYQELQAIAELAKNWDWKRV